MLDMGGPNLSLPTQVDFHRIPRRPNSEPRAQRNQTPNGSNAYLKGA